MQVEVVLMIRVGPDLPPWKNGDQDDYNRWVTTTHLGMVVQLDRNTFEFRSNTQPEIKEWLMNSHLDGELREHNGYRAQVEFDDDQGATMFKLTWVGHHGQ
jgi:hypothetical protein